MSIKISKLPEISTASAGDFLVIVQNGITKKVSKESFLKSLTSSVKVTANKLNALQSKVSKTALDKTNPRLSKPLITKDPIQPLHAATKMYVDTQVAHAVKVDGSSSVEAPLEYSGEFSFSDKNLITKEYADNLLNTTLKTITSLPGKEYPKASAGDVFVSKEEYEVFATDGPALQEGDLLICAIDSEGGTHGAAGSQFVILNTNVVLASEDTVGIVRLASDKDMRELESDKTAVTPKKYKDSLLVSSLYNRTLIDRTTYTVVEADRGILAVDTRRDSSVITLPGVYSLKDPSLFKITIKDEFGQADTKNIVIKTSGSSIENKSQIILSSKFQAITLYNDGKNYYIENNTHFENETSGRIMQTGLVTPSAAGVTETMYETDIDLAQFDHAQGFKVEVSGLFSANANTKTVTLEIGGFSTVTNATTTAPNGNSFTASVVILKEVRYAIAYGAILLDGIAADTYTTNSLNLDWNSLTTVKVTANSATINTDTKIYSMVLEPLK